MFAANAPTCRPSLAAALGLAVLSVFSLLTPARAEAQDPTIAPTVAPQAEPLRGAYSSRRIRYDAHAALSWDGNFGAGGRVDISIFDRHRLYDSHDELSVSVGGDVTFVTFGGSNLVSVWPTAMVQWSLGATERLALYPELGLVAHVEGDHWDGVYPSVGFGARYYLFRSVSVFGRFGWPMALSAGMTF